MQIDLLVVAGHEDSLELIGTKNGKILFSVVHTVRGLWDYFAGMSPAERIAFKNYLLKGGSCGIQDYCLADQNLN